MYSWLNELRVSISFLIYRIGLSMLMYYWTYYELLAPVFLFILGIILVRTIIKAANLGYLTFNSDHRDVTHSILVLMGCNYPSSKAISEVWPSLGLLAVFIAPSPINSPPHAYSYRVFMTHHYDGDCMY